MPTIQLGKTAEKRKATLLGVERTEGKIAFVLAPVYGEGQSGPAEIRVGLSLQDMTALGIRFADPLQTTNGPAAPAAVEASRTERDMIRDRLAKGVAQAEVPLPRVELPRAFEPLPAAPVEFAPGRSLDAINGALDRIAVALELIAARGE